MSKLSHPRYPKNPVGTHKYSKKQFFDVFFCFRSQRLCFLDFWSFLRTFPKIVDFPRKFQIEKISENVFLAPRKWEKQRFQRLSLRARPHYHPEKTKIRNLRFHPYFTKMFSDIQKNDWLILGPKTPVDFKIFFFCCQGRFFLGKKNSRYEAISVLCFLKSHRIWRWQKNKKSVKSIFRAFPGPKPAQKTFWGFIRCP